MSTSSSCVGSPPPFVGITRVAAGWFWAVWPSQAEFYERLRRETLPDRFGVERTKSAARRAAGIAAGTFPVIVCNSWVARSAYQAVQGDDQRDNQQAACEVRKTVCEADAAKFEVIKTQFESCRHNPLTDASLMTWTLPTDRQLPLRLLGKSLRSIMDGAFVELANTRGVGPTRLRGLLTVLERAVQIVRDSPHHHPSSGSDPLGFDSRPPHQK